MTIKLMYYIIIKLTSKPYQFGQLMSVSTLTPINDDIRYEIKIKYYKENSYVIYEIVAFDLAMGKDYIFQYRFSQIKKFHEDLIKKLQIEKQKLPQFPKTNSFGFWHRTNKNAKMIQDRKRELEYYFTKLLNDSQYRGLVAVKNFIATAKSRRRTKSMSSLNSYKIIQISTTEESKQDKMHKVNSLPRIYLSFFTKSNEKDSCVQN